MKTTLITVVGGKCLHDYLLTRFPPHPHLWMGRKGGEYLKVQGEVWEGRRRLKEHVGAKRMTTGEVKQLGLVVPSEALGWPKEGLEGGESMVQELLGRMMPSVRGRWAGRRL